MDIDFLLPKRRLTSRIVLLDSTYGSINLASFNYSTSSLAKNST